MLEVKNLSVAYGGLRALTRRFADSGSRPVRHRCRAERRRQVHAVQNDLRHRGAGCRAASAFMGKDLSAAAAVRPRASGHRACAGRPAGVQDPDGAGKPGNGRLPQGRPSAWRHTLERIHDAVSDPGRTRRPACRHAVGRRAADGGDRPRTGLRAAPADAGRAVDGPRARPSPTRSSSGSRRSIGKTA